MEKSEELRLVGHTPLQLSELRVKVFRRCSKTFDTLIWTNQNNRECEQNDGFHFRRCSETFKTSRTYTQ